jgi:hypothetical protein
MLDQLSTGRLELVVGRGNYGREGINLNPKADPPAFKRLFRGGFGVRRRTYATPLACPLRMSALRR